MVENLKDLKQMHKFKTLLQQPLLLFSNLQYYDCTSTTSTDLYGTVIFLESFRAEPNGHFIYYMK